MAKYVYPAYFRPEDNGMYSVEVPDISGCFTCGDSLADAMYMAEDALALMLYEYEAEGRAVPVPSDLHALKPADESILVSFVAADTMKYRKMYNNKAVKKTLTIPEWLNEAGVSAGINFSQLLQDALKHSLNLM